MFQSFRLVLTSVALLAAGLVASPAFASSSWTPPLFSESHDAADIICIGYADCDEAGLPDSADGIPLDFEIGLAVTAPTNLEVYSMGNIYVVASQIDVIGGIWVESCGHPVDIEDVLDPRVPLHDESVLPVSSRRDDHNNQKGRKNGFTKNGKYKNGLAKNGKDKNGNNRYGDKHDKNDRPDKYDRPDPRPTDDHFVIVNAMGDVYVELEDIELFSLILKAKGKVIIVPVPEPGTAILMGLGLSGLAMGQRRLARS